MPSAHRTARRRDDRGEASTQFVILVPIMFLLTLTVVQAALWFHAANVAEAAASQGAAAGSFRHASPGGASAAASAVVAENGAELQGGPVVATSAEQIVVTVSVAVPRLVPFFPDSVRRTQSEPRERFVPETER